MWTPRLKSSAPYVRRLITHGGWSADDVARLYGITPGDVEFILSHPPRKPAQCGRARLIRGRLGPVVRDRIVAGMPPDAIARELDLAEESVCDYILRLTPRQRHKKRTGPLLNRARSAREQAALSEWIRFQAEAVSSASPAPAAPPVEPSPPVEPELWEGPADPCSQRFPGRHRPGRKKKKRRRAPESDGRRALSRQQRDEARRLAGQGWGCQRIAKKLGVARSTIQDLLRGRSHHGDHAEPVPPQPVPTPIGLQPIAAPPEQPKRARVGKKTVGVLTPEIRDEARRLAGEGLGARAIAKRLGVPHSAIRNLLRGKTYFDDPGAPAVRPGPARWDEPADDRQRWVNAKLSYEDAVRMRKMRAEGATWKELQDAFGVSKATVQRVLSGACYAAPPRPSAIAAPARVEAPPEPAGRQDLVEPAAWDDDPDDAYRGGGYLSRSLDVEEIVRAYEAGESATAIARRLGVSPSTVAMRLRIAGVFIRSQGWYARKAHKAPVEAT